MRDLDPRGTIRIALNTDSLQIARARRDALAEADERLWLSLKAGNDNAHGRYEAARKRAIARGFVYIPAQELAVDATLEQILERLDRIEPSQPIAAKAEADAVLGLAEPKAMPIAEAFDLYRNVICAADLKGKSPNQLRNWTKVKQRAVNNFVALCGDVSMSEITRAHAKQVYDWWSGRVNPTDGSKALHANSANKDLTNLRILFERFWEYQGEESRENPFRNLRFKNVVYKDIPPFSVDWLQDCILEAEALDALNVEARGIVYALIETGCRPSEIANLRPEHIILDTNVPHLRIRAQVGRQLKSKSARRDIPLLGVSLKAMQAQPEGFPRYRDKSDLLSATLTKHFRKNGLFPTADHRIYSFRHSFEKRMLEAELDYGLRCTLIGHFNNRPGGGIDADDSDEVRQVDGAFPRP